MSWDMYESDAAEATWERHQETLRRAKRIAELVKVFKEIDPSLSEARDAWKQYKSEQELELSTIPVKLTPDMFELPKER